MRVSRLYGSGGPLFGKDVFIVGTGPSMDEFPMSLLDGKVCVGLNDACRLFGIGPVAFSNSLDFIDGVDRNRVPIQVVKGRLQWSPNPERTDNHCRWDDPDHYVFSYRDRRWDRWDHFDAEAMWREPDFYWNVEGGCSAVFGLQFVLLAGAASVTFVGCDSCRLGDLNYTDRPGKRQRYHVKRRMHQYADGVMRVAMSARRTFPGVPIVSLVPFFGLGYHDSQYRAMRLESGAAIRTEEAIRKAEHQVVKDRRAEKAATGEVEKNDASGQ